MPRISKRREFLRAIGLKPYESRNASKAKNESFSMENAEDIPILNFEIDTKSIIKTDMQFPIEGDGKEIVETIVPIAVDDDSDLGSDNEDDFDDENKAMATSKIQIEWRKILAYITKRQQTKKRKRFHVQLNIEEI
jgi:hypothetical protein